MSSESTTLRALKTELEQVEAAIARYTKTREALREVIDFLGSEHRRGARRTDASPHLDV